jgi:hypothetical protein
MRQPDAARTLGSGHGPASARVGAFLRLPPRDRLTAVHALAAATLVELLIRQVRLPVLARLAGVALGRDRPAGGDSPPEERGPAAGPDVARAVRSTRRVLRSWPFARGGTCLREALVLGHLLRARSPVLRIGVAHGKAGLLAHAWLEVDGLVLGDSRGFATFEQLGGRSR